MAFDLYDFAETLRIAGVDKADVERVTLAFGDGGHDYNEWEGGFVLLMKDGSWRFAFGWCDTTGWGCQDGAWVHRFDAEPTADDLHKSWKAEEMHGNPPLEHSDPEPADLARYLAGEVKLPY